jgi:hypothetical protein
MRATKSGQAALPNLPILISAADAMKRPHLIKAGVPLTFSMPNGLDVVISKDPFGNRRSEIIRSASSPSNDDVRGSFFFGDVAEGPHRSLISYEGESSIGYAVDIRLSSVESDSRDFLFSLSSQPTIPGRCVMLVVEKFSFSVGRRTNTAVRDRLEMSDRTPQHRSIPSTGHAPQPSQNGQRKTSMGICC